MKLNAAQVEQTLSQFDAEVLPDGHPARGQLNELFGEHTFFLDNSGLNIVETVETPDDGTKAGEIVNLAHWSDASFARLKVHEPEHTGVTVKLESRH
jgi:hypothetical protein